MFDISLCVGTWGRGLTTIPSHSFDDTIGTLRALDEQVYPDKNDSDHLMWFGTTFNIDPETGKQECKNDLANPTCLFGLDFDDTTNKISDVKKCLESMGCDFYIHSTMSYIPDVKEKCRAVIHLSQPVHNNVENVLVFNTLQHQVFGPKNLVLDRACKNIARKFYTPAKNTRNGGVYFEHWEFGRGAFDVSAMVTIEKQKQKRLMLNKQIQQNFKTTKFLNTKRKHRSTNTQPYFNSVSDFNIADHTKANGYMSQISKGGFIVGFANHMVGYCQTRFGSVDETMLVYALDEFSGGSSGTTHNNFRQIIRDAIKHCGV